MKKSTADTLDIYDPELKCHVADLLVTKGALSFRQLRLFVIESFPVGALMPTLQEMLTEGKVHINSEGYWYAPEVQNDLSPQPQSHDSARGELVQDTDLSSRGKET